MKTHKLDMELAFPGDVATCDACVERVLSTLDTSRGVERAHIDRGDPAHPRLCLHYEPSSVELDEVLAILKHAGAELEARYEHLSLPDLRLRHERQARLVEGTFTRHPGVLRAKVAFNARRLDVEYSSADTNRDALFALAAKTGIIERARVPAPAHKEHDHSHGTHGSGRLELAFSITCGVLTLLGWTLGKLGVATAATTSIFMLAYVFGGWFTVQEALAALRARKLEIDLLMLLAAIGAAFLGVWFEGALLLTLFTIGHALEAYAMRRARSAIGDLAELAPESALRLDDGGREQEVPVAELVIGDRILVKPNARLSADGFVSAGEGSIDQAPITGESIPAEKRPVPDFDAALADPESLAPENRVFTGTLNGATALTVVVTKISSESTFAHVVKLVTEAAAHKSPTQRLIERFERYFTPLILAGAALLLLASFFMNEPFAQSFYRAMAMLVAASPCALAIATPSAILSGVARAARAGVLVKGGAYLESLGLVRAVAFDKTGTLTSGKPRLTDVVTLDGTSEDELLMLARAAEKYSDHPIASAIVAGAFERYPNLRALEPQRVEALTGFGVRAFVENAEVLIGKPKLFESDGPLPANVEAIAQKLAAEGRTVMVLRAGARYLGVLGVMDTPRPGTRAIIAELHALGIDETVMLTGDNQRAADAVAQQVGITTAYGDLLPEQKVAAVAKLTGTYRRVAMIGDGVNDAPAMATASVGIAMGASGSDVALATADIALMADDLLALPFAVALSRRVRNILRQNLVVSLGMVAILVPSAIAGVTSIGATVALHEGSTLLVVANALRLLGFTYHPKASAPAAAPTPRSSM